MSLLKKLPVFIRSPLLHSTIWALGLAKSRSWLLSAYQSGPFVITGFFSEYSGVAQGARLSLQAFERAGFAPVKHDITACYRHYLRGDGQFPVTEPGGVWFIHANAQESLISLLAYPPETWIHRYRIGYWAWETTCAEPICAWIAQFFHEIWVPSTFVGDALKSSFQQNGKAHLADRIRIMPHPVTEKPDAVAERTRFGLDPDALECLCIFDLNSTAIRKNPWATLDVWRKAFPAPQPKVNLRLKVNGRSGNKAASAHLENLIRGRPDISMITERFDEDAMPSFMASFDLLISLHRSEGFGLTLAEAMINGVCVLATGWSGNMDFMSEENSYPVPYKIIPVSDPGGMYGGLFNYKARGQFWCEPDTTAAAALLQTLARDKTQRLMKVERARMSIKDLQRPWLHENLPAVPFHQ